MTTWMLIHSPLVGPTTWRPVAHELEHRRRQAIVPSLIGVANAPAPQWRHCIEVVRAAAEGFSRLLLVSHSGAGTLLPPIADAVSAVLAGADLRGLVHPAGQRQRKAHPAVAVAASSGDRDGWRTSAVVGMVWPGGDGRAGP